MRYSLNSCVLSASSVLMPATVVYCEVEVLSVYDALEAVDEVVAHVRASWH
jgi:hypothetical protein